MVASCATGVVVLLIACLAGTPAWAQNRVRQNRDVFQDKTPRFKAKQLNSVLDGLGYRIADGIVLSPTIAIEGGHDSDPDELFNGRDTPYGLVDSGLTLTVLRPNFLTKASLTGSYVNYADLPRDDRWSAGASIDTTYQVRPGLAVSAGGAYNRDTIEFTEDENTTGYVQIDHVNGELQSFARGRVVEVRYLSQPPIPGTVPANVAPFLLNSALDARRDEVGVGALYGRSWFAAVYGELGAARADYFNQPNEAVVDRDAEDFYAIAGMRITFSPWLRADIGYRFNYRNLEDRLFSTYDTSYFDGSLIWVPRPDFSLQAEIDRKLTEPGAAFSRVADVTRFALSANWKPSYKSLLQVRLSDERIREVGDIFTFHERSLAAEYSYNLTNAIQLYAGVLAKRVSEDFTEQEYDRIRVGVGTRIRLGIDEAAPVTLSIKDGGPIENIEYPPLGIDAVAVSYGYSHLDLPATEMMTTVGGGFFDRVTGKITDHDGELDGYRVSAEINKFASHTFSTGLSADFSLDGFYSHYEGTDRSSCDFTAVSDCVFVNIVDPDPVNENNTGAFGRLAARTKREADYWGVALSADFGHETLGGSLKDSFPVRTPLPFKIGIAMRALQQNLDLFAIDVSVPDPVDYDEALDTYYWGAFIGLERSGEIAGGLTLTLDAHAGVYYARTDYDGHYISFVPIGGAVFQIENARLSLEDDSSALIAGLNIGLERDLGWGTIGIFAEGEYNSYVPRVAYNDNDNAGGTPFGLVGRNARTTIQRDDMVSYTLGGRLRIPLNR